MTSSPPALKPLPEYTAEEGKIWFFYKSKVQLDAVGSLNDVQRFFILLQPTQRQLPPPLPAAPPASGGDCGSPERGDTVAAAGAHGEGGTGASAAAESTAALRCCLIIVPKKRLPDTGRPGRERHYAFVDAVADDPKELTDGLESRTYQTKTRGLRFQGPARCVGEGLYVIVRHGRGTNLAYRLVVPPGPPGDAQRLFAIREAGSFVFSIKNPANASPGVPSAGPEPEYSERQAKRLKGASWIGVEDASMLEVVGTEVLLVAASGDPERQLGADGAELMAAAAQEGHHLIEEASREEGGVARTLQEEVGGSTQGGATAANGEGHTVPVLLGPAVDGKLL